MYKLFLFPLIVLKGLSSSPSVPTAPPQQTQGYAGAIEAFAAEADVDSELPDKAKGLLEKKWTSVVTN